jgi:hypothetical protein
VAVIRANVGVALEQALGVAASLPADAVQIFDQEQAVLLAERFPGDPFWLPHRVWALLARALKVTTQTSSSRSTVVSKRPTARTGVL